MHAHSSLCCWHGCEALGTYPAPKIRHLPVSYHTPFAVADDVPLARDYYCLQHIREFNQHWNFFHGMTQEEIEQFQKDALTGHRHTRSIHPHMLAQAYAKAETLRNNTPPPSIPTFTQQLSPEMQHALRILGIEKPQSPQELKQRYRALVKQFHPDKIGVRGEEKIKVINHAYMLVKTLF